MKLSELLEQLQKFPCQPDTEVIGNLNDKTLFTIKQAVPIALMPNPFMMLVLEEKKSDEA